MSKEQIATIALGAWRIFISIFMLLEKSVTLEIFFVLYLIGFLILLELFATKYIRPGYLRYIQYILAVG